MNSLKHVILTHWHPDHTLGLRILEQYNFDFVNKVSLHEPVMVYISRDQFDMFKKLSCGGFLDFYEKKGIIKLVFIEPNKKITIGKISIEPILIEFTKGFYFVISEGKKKVVYAPCEYHHLEVDVTTRNVDVFIAHNLFWEDRSISPRKVPPSDEDSFEQMLNHAKEMNARRIVITHIEETFKLNHDELNAVLRKKFPGYNVEAGYDSMKIIL
ncbi:MAG: MBL fold metallo-hydrolase [Candidatus Woesearchaeota archaeon]